MLELSGIDVSFGPKSVLRDCSLLLREGERLALMGPSGCGKTTLLRVALGLQRPDAGRRRCTAARVAAVFQEPRLLPWYSAERNVNAVLSDRPATLETARDWLRRLELADALTALPEALSGGMRQRVALARALACGPELLVLDEPFKALDDALRGRVTAVVAGALSSCALLLATHSEEEARALGCTVLRWRDGRFEAER